MTTDKPEVKRFNITIDKYYHPVPYETEHGQWVKYSSYKALQAECEKLRKDAELWEPVFYEVHRRADKEHALADKCDFIVTIMYDEYAAIDAAIMGETE